MATGYTSALDDKGLDTETWIKEHLARQFGICVMMREEGHLTEDEIIKRLEADDDVPSYNEKELAKAQEESLRLKARTDEEWKADMDAKNAETNKRNAESIRKAAALKERHDEVRADLKRIRDNPDTSEITRNVVQFGIDQLDLVESGDCKAYVWPLIPDWPTHMKDTTDRNLRNIGYHVKEIAKSKERTSGRADAYKRLLKDVDATLKRDQPTDE